MTQLRWERTLGENHWRGMLGTACVVRLRIINEPLLENDCLRKGTFYFAMVHVMQGNPSEDLGRVGLAQAKRMAELAVTQHLADMGLALPEPSERSLAETLVKEGDYILDTLFGRSAFSEPDVCRVAEHLTDTIRQYLATVLAEKYGTDLGDTEEATLEILADTVTELRGKSR